MRHLISSRDRGQAVPLLFAAVVFIGCLALAVMALSMRLVERSAVQGAADAVALAGATDGRSGAYRVATEWNATVVNYHEIVKIDGVQVTVSVRIGAETAVARASTAP